MSDFDMSEFNQGVIEEFRANGGVVGGPFEGASLILVHHTGAKSGTERVTPLVYQALGDDGWAVFASKAGAPENPAWFHNLVANPDTTIEVGAETVDVIAAVADPDVRDPIWERQKALAPQFAEYEAKTDRVIPVVVFSRR
jgi:deazaflavin-dependent oxidoreductase (nitroreductase family)